VKHRTPAYWPTRILLVFGFLATLAALALTLVVLMQDGPLIDPRPDVLGLPADIAVALVALLPPVVGFAWMLRIFRVPRDGSTRWRYRDR
jgi:hypothetical protein